MSNKLIAIVGPTATGKTALGARLAHALGGEIVSADSRQVYRHMDVGTAKPTPEERALARHWLVDAVAPDEAFSLGQYLDLAGAALADIWSRGAPAFLVGGSGQYVWALLEGWQVPRVPPDGDMRRRLEERAAREGPEALHSKLAALEPDVALKIDPRNVRRVVRALEVRYRTGQPLSACRARTPPVCDTIILGLDCPQGELYGRIDARVDAMVVSGLVAEVEGLLTRGYDRSLPAMSGIGYRQVCQYLSGEMGLVEAVARIKTETHRLARMQRNWFRRTDARIHWFDVSRGVPFEEAARLVESQLGLRRVVAHER
jgi:tRNA dimethylallyltransferase